MSQLNSPILQSYPPLISSCHILQSYPPVISSSHILSHILQSYPPAISSSHILQSYPPVISSSHILFVTSTIFFHPSHFSLSDTSSSFSPLPFLMPSPSSPALLNSIDVPKLVAMAADVASGLSYLECLEYVHKDIAARNCLVTEDLCIKITGKYIH